MIPIDKSTAKRLKLKEYFTGIPCSKGHVSKRLTRNDECVECKKLYAKEYRNKNISYTFSRQVLARLEGNNIIESKKEELTMSNCEMMLGYTSQELSDHIERLFVDNMSWGNRKSFHIDHIIPVAQFKENNVTDISIINHLSNLKPLSPKDNLEKSGAFVSESDFKTYMKQFSDNKTPWERYLVARENGEVELVKAKAITKSEIIKIKNKEYNDSMFEFSVEKYKQNFLELLECGVSDIDGIHRTFKIYGSSEGKARISHYLSARLIRRDEIPYVLESFFSIQQNMVEARNNDKENTKILEEKYNCTGLYNFIMKFDWRIVDNALRHYQHEYELDMDTFCDDDFRVFSDWIDVDSVEIVVPEDIEIFSLSQYGRIVSHDKYKEVEEIANMLIDEHDVDEDCFDLVYNLVATRGKTLAEKQILIDLEIIEDEKELTASEQRVLDIASTLGIENKEEIEKLINAQGIDNAMDILERAHDNNQIVDGIYKPVKWF